MRALLSVSDKTGIIDLGRALVARGAELVSTGGTARALAEAGLSVTAVSDVTGFPEMLDGRVKTLHPAVHGGILARRGRPDDLEAIRGQGIQPIDLVVVNLYPFALTAASEATFEELIEQIDIGGPSMVRAAAKSFADVLVVVDPADYGRVVEALDGAGGPDRKLRFELARKAFAHTAAYDATIAAALDAVDTGGPAFARAPFTLSGVVPDQLSVQAPKVRELRYGENPHQRAALYTDGAWGFGRARVLQGKELSFTNLLDLDAAARLVMEFSEPAAAVLKHTNPCGAASGPNLREAYVKARGVDELSAFGGIVGLNRPLDAETASAIAETFMECVVAPAVSDEARNILARKMNLRLVAADFDGGGDAAQRDRAVHPGGVAGAATRPRGRSGRRVGRRAHGGARHAAAGRHEAPTDRRGVDGAAVRVAGVRPRQVEHRHLRARGSPGRGRGRADEPGGRGQDRGAEGGRRPRRHRGGLGCLLSVPRRARRDCDGRGDRGRPARRLEARRRGDCRRRPARHGHGLRRPPALPTLALTD